MTHRTGGSTLATALRRFGRLIVRALERACFALAAPVPGVSCFMALTSLTSRCHDPIVEAGACGQPVLAMTLWRIRDPDEIRF